jgi:hypothetical protein
VGARLAREGDASGPEKFSGCTCLFAGKSDRRPLAPTGWLMVLPGGRFLFLLHEISEVGLASCSCHFETLGCAVAKVLVIGFSSLFSEYETQMLLRITALQSAFFLMR